MKKNKIIIIIITIAILILVGLIIFFITPKNNNYIGNTYNFSDDTLKEDTYKSDQLSSKHCLNNICINDVTFYYNDKMGRVEYTITNNSNEVESGYLKMVFNDQSLLVIYKNLNPNETINSRSQYEGIEIKDKSDYKLEKLTKEEISKIVK